jgi:hypothetical protein
MVFPTDCPRLTALQSKADVRLHKQDGAAHLGRDSANLASHLHAFRQDSGVQRIISLALDPHPHPILLLILVSAITRPFK